MFTGAFAVSYYGIPRTTMDIDVVASLQERLTYQACICTEDSGLKVDRRRIDLALRSSFRMATLRDSKTPFTVDIILSSTKLEKRAGSILGLPTFYQTPEDLILAKLRMIKATVPRERSLKDVDDVRAILKFSEVQMNVLKR